ncbi:MAG TPA: T9SS type A sorting domain-containing protein, partial [Paludibacter sp.]|nr:T9SS type A sorting domain-containing protein [Paludibacter sp.]
IARTANENQLITELKVFDNDSTFRYVYLYDNDGKKMLETRYYKQTNSWNRISQTEWLYEAGKCKHQIERNWKNNEWTDSYKIDYNYLNGVLDNEIHKNYINKTEQQLKKIVYQYYLTTLTSKKEYSYKSNVWTLMCQTDFKYSQTSAIDSVITSVYQSENLINQYLAVNSYSADGHLESQLQKEKASNSDWTNTQSVSWFYSPGYSKLLTERTKIWNSENSAWENYQRTDYEYNDNNQLVSETYQHWKIMFWESDLRYDYQHDADGNEIKKTLSKPIYHEWRNLISINYSDFTGNKANLMESKYEFWGGSTGELVSSYIPFNFNNETAIQRGRSLQISYLDVTDTLSAVPESTASTQSIPVYPNPSDGIYYINTQEYGVQSWVIADLDGRMLKNHVQSISSGVIDITDLPKGIYILKVTTQTAQFSQKLIKH